MDMNPTTSRAASRFYNKAIPPEFLRQSFIDECTAPSIRVGSGAGVFMPTCWPDGARQAHLRILQADVGDGIPARAGGGGGVNCDYEVYEFAPSSRRQAPPSRLHPAQW